MRKLQSVLVLLIAAAVHLDWHLGRPEHMQHSLAWEHHWIFGLILGSCIACFLTWRRAAAPVSQFLLVALAGFVAGQILEPIGEVLIFDESLSFVYPVVRWVLFLEFAAAFLAGGMACLVLQRLLSRNASNVSAA